MCHTLVHELCREQLKTSKELLDIATQHASLKTSTELLNIATQHASGVEAIGAAFVLGNAKASMSGGRAAPSKATVKGTRKGAKGGKKGQKWHP
jgi:hypothetical protein